MGETFGRLLLWVAALSTVAVINAIDTWGACAVRDWVFGQTGAAWVQAFGSIGAIAFGFWYSEHNARKAEKAQHDKNFRLLAKLAIDIVTHLQEFGGHFALNPTFVPVVDDATLEDWLLRLRSIDAQFLDPPDRGRYETVRKDLRTISMRMREGAQPWMDRAGVDAICSRLMINVYLMMAQKGKVD